MNSQSNVNRLRKIIQFLWVKRLPITGKNMIVNHIDNDRCVATLCFSEPFNSLLHHRMRIREGIYGPMEPNAIRHFSIIDFVRISFHGIRNEIAEQQFIVIRSQKNVSEEIHLNSKISQKERESGKRFVEIICLTPSGKSGMSALMTTRFYKGCLWLLNLFSNPNFEP